ARVRGRRRVRAVRTGALRTTDAAAPDELARASAGTRRAEARGAPIRAADRHQLGGLRWTAGMHLLRLVRFGMPDWSEGHGIGDLLEQGGATRRAGHQRSLRASGGPRRREG